MDILLKNLETDVKVFKQTVEQRITQNKKPLIITFIMPNTNFFDILRLIKLYELNRAGFYLLLIIEESENQKESKSFMKIINQFVPNNKEIFLYDDIMNDLQLNKEYRDLIFSYRIENLKKFNKYLKSSNFSLSDLNQFLTQYFILKNSKLFLNQEPDFFLTTSYKNLFFRSIPNFNETRLPIKIILKDTPLDWNFKSSIKTLERTLIKTKISAKTISSLKRSLFSIESLLQERIRDKDFISIVTLIKKFLEHSDVKQECFVTKSNFQNIISILNNKTRRKIISILSGNKKMKAEEIRKIINLESEKKDSLTNIIKHLNLLINSDLVYKRDRIYTLKTKRIILDIPISWFASKH